MYTVAELERGRRRVRAPSVHALAVRAVGAVSRRLPVRRRVLLASAHAGSIRGNLVAVCHAMSARRDLPPPVVVAYRARSGLRGTVRTLGAELRASYYAATSRVVVVDDQFFPLRVNGRRPGTTVVQTWHACGALKRFGHSVGDDADGRRARPGRRSPADGSPYSLLLASSERTARLYADAFDEPFEKFVWQIGIPRTDGLVRYEPASVERLRSRLGIPVGRRVILYAPTFRGDPRRSARSPVELDLRVLRDALGADHVLLLRLHPHVRPAERLDADLEGFVFDVSRHPEVNELLLLSDALVTDYSSVLFEFALLERPIVLFAPDLQDYEAERGFYVDYRAEAPGPICTTTRDVARHLRAPGFDPARVREFRDRWFAIADGHSAERFVERVVAPALGPPGRGGDGLRDA